MSSDYEWVEDAETIDEEYPISEYDLTSTPNDFNVLTLVSFVDQGAVDIPSFQRHYVWDIKRASKLIESLIIGLPVPQIFFYEKKKNSYLVIDGQQRLMTIYYFIKGRFPIWEKRIEIRNIFTQNGSIPKEIISDDKYFSNFNLALPTVVEGQRNKFHEKNYNTLGENLGSFNLRTIRSIIVKPTVETENDTAVYEIFNRLNTGGINLSSQEIRVSLYDSDFMKMLIRLNGDVNWRKIIRIQEDIHMKDVEILLRAAAILIAHERYETPMTKFINNVAKQGIKFEGEKILKLDSIFKKYFEMISSFSKDAMFTSTNKFSLVLFETIFCIVCSPCLSNREILIITEDKINQLKKSKEYIDASTIRSTDKSKMKKRMEIARAVLLG
jgi:hypothetical protein